MAVATRKELVERAFSIWNTHAETYRTLILQYRTLLSLKRELKIRPLYQVKASVIEDYPNIPLLNCLTEHDVEAYLATISTESLGPVLDCVEFIINYDCSYRTLSAKIIDYEYEINNKSDWTAKKGHYCPDLSSFTPTRDGRKKHYAITRNY